MGSPALSPLPPAYNVSLYVARGEMLVNGDWPAHTQQLVVLGSNSADVQLTASADSLVLVLASAPIEELIQTIADFESGNMGKFLEDE